MWCWVKANFFNIIVLVYPVTTLIEMDEALTLWRVGRQEIDFIFHVHDVVIPVGCKTGRLRSNYRRQTIASGHLSGLFRTWARINTDRQCLVNPWTGPPTALRIPDERPNGRSVR